MQYNTTQYNIIQYNAIQHNTIQYNTIQYNAIQCNTIQYNTAEQKEQVINITGHIHKGSYLTLNAHIYKENNSRC